MLHRRLSFLIVALCAACGGDFQATGSGGSDGDGGKGNAPGSSGTGADAGDTSSGGTGEAGEAGATNGGSDPGTGGAISVAGSGGGVSPGAGSGGTISLAGAGGIGPIAGAGGGTDDKCATIRTQYLALVDAARVCEKGSTDECSPKFTLPAATACGCPYLINGKANTEKAEAKYEELQKSGCLKGINCPLALCAVYESASCEQGAGTKATFVCSGGGFVAN